MPLDHKGTTLSYSTDDFSTDDNEIGEVVNVQAVSVSVEPVEKHNLSSGYKTYRPSKVSDPGQITFTVQYDPTDTDHSAIRGYVDDPSTYSQLHWKVDYSDGTSSDKCEGFPISFEVQEIQRDDTDNVMADITVQCTGGWTTA